MEKTPNLITCITSDCLTQVEEWYQAAGWNFVVCDTRMSEMDVWLVQNCEGRHCKFPNGFAFELESDAKSFALAWI